MAHMTTIIVLSALPREIKPIQKKYPGEIIEEAGLKIMHYKRGSSHVFSAYGGMGTTNIAAAAQTLLTVARYETVCKESQGRIDALIFTGIAGNLNARLGFGDVVIGRTLVYEDTDTAIIAEDPPFLETFKSTPELVDIAHEILVRAGAQEVANNAHTPDAAAAMYTPAGIRNSPAEIDDHTSELRRHRFTVGTLATSNLFSTQPDILTRIINEDYADAEEMEGTAVAHVCAKNGVDVLVIRAMSNDCGQSYEQLELREDDLNTAAYIAASIADDVVEKVLL